MLRGVRILLGNFGGNYVLGTADCAGSAPRGSILYMDILISVKDKIMLFTVMRPAAFLAQLKLFFLRAVNTVWLAEPMCLELVSFSYFLCLCNFTDCT